MTLAPGFKMNLTFISTFPTIRTQSTSNRQRRRKPSMQVDGSENEAGETSAASASSACPSCGHEGGPTRGCDGNGRIQGGLGAVVKWWPIKAYRPCPEFLKTKKTYQRAGQSLEEIAFGRKGEGDDLSISERLGGK